MATAGSKAGPSPGHRALRFPKLPRPHARPAYAWFPSSLPARSLLLGLLRSFPGNSYRSQVDGQALGPTWLPAIPTAIPDRAGRPSWTGPALSAAEKRSIPGASGTGQEQPRRAVGFSSALAHVYPASSPALESKCGQGGACTPGQEPHLSPFHRPLSAALGTRAQSYRCSERAHEPLWVLTPPGPSPRDRRGRVPGLGLGEEGKAHLLALGTSVGPKCRPGPSGPSTPGHTPAGPRESQPLGLTVWLWGRPRGVEGSSLFRLGRGWSTGPSKWPGIPGAVGGPRRHPVSCDFSRRQISTGKNGGEMNK